MRNDDAKVADYSDQKNELARQFIIAGQRVVFIEICSRTSDSSMRSLRRSPASRSEPGQNLLKMCGMGRHRSDPYPELRRLPQYRRSGKP